MRPVIAVMAFGTINVAGGCRERKMKPAVSSAGKELQKNTLLHEAAKRKSN